MNRYLRFPSEAEQGLGRGRTGQKAAGEAGEPSGGSDESYLPRYLTQGCYFFSTYKHPVQALSIKPRIKWNLYILKKYDVVMSC